MNTLRMQRQQITKLKKDNERMKEDLALETRQAKQANNMSASAQISKLQDQVEMYTRKIEMERRRIEELDKQIKSLENTIFQQQKEMGGINASRENNDEVQKKIRRLENRLDKALVKFNEALAHNKQLRETIDNLRRERVVFDGIYQKLERELHEKKNKMAEIIVTANAAYEARNKAQEQMILLKGQADKEQQKFEVEWSQLGQLIEKDRKVKDFTKSKEKDGTSSRAENSQLEEEQRLRKQVSKGAWGIAKDKESIKLSMEKVQSYEEAFAKIQKATGITDIDELVQTFVNAEDQNFTLFNYANDLTAQQEKLEESIKDYKKEAIKYSGAGQAEENSKRKKILEGLETKLQTTDTRAATFEEKSQAAQKTTEALKTGIQEMFDKISTGEEVLGDGKVTDSNMMSYLGILEERTTYLMEVYAEKKQADAEAAKQAERAAADGSVEEAAAEPEPSAA